MLRGYVCKVNTLGPLFISAASEANELNLNRILLQNRFSCQKVQAVFETVKKSRCVERLVPPKMKQTQEKKKKNTTLKH